MNALKIIASFFICGAGQILYKKFKRGFFFFIIFLLSLSFGCYRFFIQEITTSVTYFKEIEIKISFFYFGLALLIWLYNLVDIFEIYNYISNLSKEDHYEQGRIASLTGDYNRARTEFEKALKLNRQDKDALFQLGRAYFYLGMENKAKKIFDKYLKSGDKKWINKIQEILGR